MNYLSLNTFLKDTFGCKVYKLAIDCGFTCPNRDGTIDTRGCIFCSGSGSGDFASSRNLSIRDQIEEGKKRVSGKIREGKYIAYFQAFTNTYADISVLRDKYTQAINHPDIVAISIATRPDCLSENVLNLLSELNMIKPVWVELGLQTIHEKTADFIRRGYSLSVYDKVIHDLKERNIYTIVHVILGLPAETEDMILETVKYVCDSGIDGIKLQLLHIIEGTDLCRLYRLAHSVESEKIGLPDCMKEFECMDLDTYASLIAKCIEIIPNNICIHRMTGDGDKRTLVAPLWSGDKKRVLNTINKRLS